MRAIVLTAMPALPRSNFEGRRDSPTRRFLNIRPMTMMFAVKIPRVPNAMTILKAMVEPMLIRLSIAVVRNVDITELTGIPHPGGT